MQSGAPKASPVTVAIFASSNKNKEKSLRLVNEFSKYGKVCGFGIDQIKSKPVDMHI